MIRSLTLAAFALAASTLFASPAQAAAGSYGFVPAHLVSQAGTSVPIAGSGNVVIQVEVFPDGSHKVIKVIRTSNPADNAAALDIAKNSKYRPATRNGKAEISYYDFTIRFTGKAAASSGTSSSGSSSSKGSGQIDRLIRSGNYAAAKSAAQAALAAHPNDATLNQQLATADYFSQDYTGAAAAFDKVSSITRPFVPVAAQAYAMAAVKLATGGGNTTQAVAYGQKAVALQSGANAYYALGTAQLQAGDSTSAVTSLKKAYQLASSDPKVTKETKLAIDSQLLAAYLKSGDTADATTLGNEISRLDPNSRTAKIIAGNHYIALGNAASKAGNHTEAISDYEQAAAAGDPGVAVTAYAAAALEQNSILQAQKTLPSAADYGKVKAYADKALAINPDDALANFAEGVGLAGEYVAGGNKDASLKSQALAALNKAKAAAQASGNISLSLNIDNFIKATFK